MYYLFIVYNLYIYIYIERIVIGVLIDNTFNIFIMIYYDNTFLIHFLKINF